MKVTERIFEILEKKEITQTELAQALKIPITTVNYWKKKNTNPDIQYIDKICKFLDCDLYWLLDIKEIPYLTQLSETEREIICAYRTIDEKRKVRLEERASVLLEEYEEEKKKRKSYMLTSKKNENNAEIS